MYNQVMSLLTILQGRRTKKIKRELIRTWIWLVAQSHQSTASRGGILRMSPWTRTIGRGCFAVSLHDQSFSPPIRRFESPFALFCTSTSVRLISGWFGDMGDEWTSAVITMANNVEIAQFVERRIVWKKWEQEAEAEKQKETRPSHPLNDERCAPSEQGQFERDLLDS